MAGMLVIGPVAIGLTLLAMSIPPILKILDVLKTSSLRSGWRLLAAFVAAFIAGYAVFGWLHLSQEPTTADIVVSLILLLGAVFVLSVAHLSSSTSVDILRIATLERAVFTDELTGLFNRRYLASRIFNEINRARRYKLELSLIMLDLDRFKDVNDTYGHQFGDEVLRSVSIVMSQTIRASDVAVRYGGEEFLIILTNTGFAGAKCVAERLRANLGGMQVWSANGQPVRVTASMGVSTLAGQDRDAGALIKRADDALYKAKQQGRDRVCEQPPISEPLPQP